MASSTLLSNGRLVNIGTHSLALYTRGPEPSSSQDPVVLFISGVASDALIWQAVVRLLGLSLRSYTYDRSGYHNSESSPLAPSAENVALELSLLIEKAPIPNPLILVGHSWAGVLTHEYIALNGTDQIAGLVLLDANHETAPLVGDKPVYVVGGTRSRDWSRLYKAGVAKGNGTEEQRTYVRELIKTVDAKNEALMKEFLKLSTKSELVFATESGHCVQMAQPEIVVDGVKWVLDNLPVSS
jgi:pimeloyl-ACP methyl ester carboxylesterase